MQTRMHTHFSRRGLTLVEIIVAITLLAIIGGAVLIRMNPFGEVAASRNTQRTLHLQGLMVAIRQNISESGTNSFACSSGTIPTTATKMASGAGSYNIAPCLVPAYLSSLPFDARATNAHYTSNQDYDTGYFISRNASTSQITLTAPSAELGKNISLTR